MDFRPCGSLVSRFDKKKKKISHILVYLCPNRCNCWIRVIVVAESGEKKSVIFNKTGVNMWTTCSFSCRSLVLVCQNYNRSL